MTTRTKDCGWISKRLPRAATCAMALAIAVSAITVPVQAQTVSVLYSFGTTTGDGLGPSGNLIRDSAGNLYGSTFLGGASDLGTVFKVDASGSETVLYSFIGGANGGNPNLGLLRDTAGNLYGTSQEESDFILGAVFELSPSGTETVLQTFSSTTDGQYPRSSLIRDAAGNFYGTAAQGGTQNLGLIYTLDSSGSLTVLYNFAGGTDGAYPLASLIRDAAGNLYGTTLSGGEGICDDCKTIFKLDATGTETVLHTFTGADGARLGSGLTRDQAGNLYGTTVYGGVTSVYCKSGCGTVFKLDSSGNLTVLHSFTGKLDGKNPMTTLIRDAAGNLYGTTEEGGAFNLGTVFKIGPMGRESVLRSFTGGTDGSTPYGGLLEDATGNLYGCALNGGAFGQGTIFKITP